MDENKTLYTIGIFTENRVGILSLISNTFTRRKLNIETLSVSPSSIEGVHKFTITTKCDLDTIDKLVKQIEKRIDVLKAFYYTNDEIVYQEIALYKVPTSELLAEPNLEKIIRTHNARILEITPDYTVLEKSGHYEETQSLFEELKRFDIRQFVRSGRVAVTKSTSEYVTEFLEQRNQCKEELEEEWKHQ